MKIVELQTHLVWPSRDRSWLFVEVRTDAGLVGFGEASQSRNDQGVIEEVKRLAPQYVGNDPLDLIQRRHALLEWPYIGRTMFAAVSALEQALWDLIGKHLHVPVYQLLGGRGRDRVRAYANVGYAATGPDPEHVASAAVAAVQDGFDAIKFYPFGARASAGFGSGEEARWVSNGVETVRAVRRAVGDDVDIMVDLMHQFRDLKQVRDIARRLDACNLFWLEDPFVHDYPEQLAELRQAMGPRLAGGAPLLASHEWRPLLEARALDVIMPDVKWAGGISQLKQIAAMADVFGVMVSPHNASGPVANAASVHLSLGLPNFIILEYPWGVPSWRADLTRGSERVIDGHFAAPLTPGLGIELDLMTAARHGQPAPLGATAPGVRLPLH